MYWFLSLVSLQSLTAETEIHSEIGECIKMRQSLLVIALVAYSLLGRAAGPGQDKGPKGDIKLPNESGKTDPRLVVSPFGMPGMGMPMPELKGLTVEF
jgi:hypothetical protein